MRLGAAVVLLRPNFFCAPAYLAARVAQISLFLGRIKFKYSVGSLGRASTELRCAAAQSECACPVRTDEPDKKISKMMVKHA